VLLSDWIEELRRRRVLLAVLAFGLVVFAIFRFVDPRLLGFRLQEWPMTAVSVLLAVGFPLVGTITWLLDARRRPGSTGSQETQGTFRLDGGEGHCRVRWSVQSP